jgi:putative sigma-54 modulation protein
MEVIVRSRGVEFGDTLRDYVERKVSKLDRFFPDIREAEVDLVVQNSRSAEERQVAQITLRANHGLILRAEERSADMRSSIDTALDKLERQVKRYKGKRWSTRPRHQVEETEPTLEELEEEEDALDQVVRVKEFHTRPMDVDEAIQQMELLGHDFFVFYNVNTSNYSVVYRRRGEGYGLLLPELV